MEYFNINSFLLCCLFMCIYYLKVMTQEFISKLDNELTNYD